MAEDIIEVTELDFNYNVLEYSFQTPVVVDFWAAWCNPCKVLTPILEHLAHEAQGDFRLAKINVDQNTNLAIRLGIHSLPHVKGIKNGQVVGEFVGIQPESRIREFIQKLTPHPVELWITKGDHFYELKDFIESENAYKQALEIQSDNSRALLGLVKTYIRLNKFLEAEQILSNFPPSKEYPAAELLTHLIKAIKACKNLSQPSTDLDAAYQHGMNLWIKGNYYAALDGFLEILRNDKNFQQGTLKTIILAALELLGDSDPETRSYRQELATILF